MNSDARKRWRKRFPERVRAASKRQRESGYTRFWEYGVTPGDVARLFEAQGRACAICRSSNPGGCDWCLDHDHETGKVRGLLCAGCNLGLGHFKDSPLALEAASAYLRKHGA